GVNVSVGGRPPQIFAIDTGGELTVVPASLVTALALKPVGTYSFLSLSGKGFQIPMYALPPLRVGDVTLPQSFAANWDGLDRLAVPPLLSLWSFANRPVTIDVAHKTLTFEDAQSFAARTRNAHRVPLAVSRDRDRMLVVFANLDLGNGQRGQCEIDTGSKGTMIDARYLPLLGFAQSDKRVVSERSDQAEGPRTDYLATLPAIALSDAPAMQQSNVAVGFTDHPIYDCLIGNDFWADKVFTFDLAHEQLFVAPSR
ncbi:MAG TPA: aspartyl protease family protein, partial [Candidatus Acidoferrales bacterium]|nr:aspartyl protease family protein [Candidatus Acidoferrales bacterium]